MNVLGKCEYCDAESVPISFYMWKDDAYRSVCIHCAFSLFHPQMVAEHIRLHTPDVYYQAVDAISEELKKGAGQ